MKNVEVFIENVKKGKEQLKTDCVVAQQTDALFNHQIKQRRISIYSLFSLELHLLLFFKEIKCDSSKNAIAEREQRKYQFSQHNNYNDCNRL